MKIGIITYSSSNTANVKRLFEKVFKQNVFEIKNNIETSDVLILPGVGNFGFVKKELDMKGITKDTLLNNFKYIFGICLGMHLLQGESHESYLKNNQGFNFTDKSVIKIASNLKDRRVHTGWNYVTFIKKEMSFLTGYYFFSHSYGILWKGAEDELAFYIVNDKKFVAVSSTNHFCCVQFHPELSGLIGRKLIKFFIK